MRLETVEVKLRIQVGKVRCGRVSVLLIDTGFLKFIIQGVNLLQVTRVAKLADDTGGSHEHTFFITFVVCPKGLREPREFNGAANSPGVKAFASGKSVHDIKLGTIDMIR